MAANINNYIGAGNAAVKNSYAALKAARDNSPKYDELAKEGMRSRAKQKIAAMQADADVKRTQIQANTFLKKNEIVSDANKSIDKSKKKTQFAGKIAAAGAVMATSLLPSAEIIKPTPYDFSRSQARLDQQKAENDKRLEGLQNSQPTKVDTSSIETKKTTETNPNTATFIAGSTGVGTGPHLHASVFDTEVGSYIRPTGLYEHHITGPQGQSLQSYTMSSGYGPRTAPTAGASTNHRGEDWRTPEGTPLTVNLEPLTGQYRRQYDSGGGFISGYQLSPTRELHLMHGQRLPGE